MNDDSNYISTFTGRRVYPWDFQPEDVCIEDIAHHLSNICRFTGATRNFYSVAQHSCLVAWFAPMNLRLPALLHDAAEAYWNDLSTPIKRRNDMNWYANQEHYCQQAIFKAFDIKPFRYSLVKEADTRAFTLERKALIQPLDPFHTEFSCDSPQEAEKNFLIAFRNFNKPQYKP